MRITRVAVEPRRTPLAVPYRIAGRMFDTADILCLTLHEESGLTGYGTATPVEHLTGDGFESGARALRAMADALLGADVSRLEESVARAQRAAPAARAALAAADIALHDLHAKRRGVPLATMLGGIRRRLITSVTVGIGDPEEMVDAARRHAAAGFKIIKVKVGEDAAGDIDRLRRIRAAVGPRVKLRIDANEGYAEQDALEVARELEALSIELFEQPVAAGHLEGLRKVALATAAPVVVDEAAGTAADLPPLIGAGAARGANIKLMKSGGLLEARRIDRALHAASWPALVGCMDESRAGIAAAAHFAAAAASVCWIDLDGHLDLAEDPFDGGFEIHDGEIVLSDAPGLGVSPARDART
jgi:L-Ala-D/L-Glu epimerase / N-acetyl-D-glutamate racemase